MTICKSAWIYLCDSILCSIFIYFSRSRPIAIRPHIWPPPVWADRGDLCGYQIIMLELTWPPPLQLRPGKLWFMTQSNRNK